MGQYGVTTPKLFLDSNLFHQLQMTPVKFGVKTSGIRKVSSLSFDPYKERKNPSLCVLAFNLKAHWSWNLSVTRIRLRVGLQLLVLIPSLVQHLVHVLELLLSGS
jgi:hypothetical protein